MTMADKTQVDLSSRLNAPRELPIYISIFTVDTDIASMFK